MQDATKGNGIGAPVRRKEDMRLVTGAGCFSDDVNLPRQARAFVLRRCMPTRVTAIDAARAWRSRASQC
jgi:carbon-monoxide dehydrogenase large subunit